MLDKINEQLSAGVDDELDVNELSFVVRRLGADDDLRERLERYYLIGETLRRGLPTFVDKEFSARVRDDVDRAEVLEAERSQRTTKRLWKPVAGAAIAASVAVIGVFGLRSITEVDSNAPTSVAQVIPSTVPVESGIARVVDLRPKLGPTTQMAAPDSGRSVERFHGLAQRPQVEIAEATGSRPLNDYLVHHNRFAASAGVQGVPPYARIVGYGPER